jgi:hypothetical protein
MRQRQVPRLHCRTQDATHLWLLRPHKVLHLPAFCLANTHEIPVLALAKLVYGIENALRTRSDKPEVSEGEREGSERRCLRRSSSRPSPWLSCQRGNRQVSLCTDTTHMEDSALYRLSDRFSDGPALQASQRATHRDTLAAAQARL